MRLFNVFFAALIASSYAQSGPCYFSNGTTLPDNPDYNQYEPCATGPTTTCCGTNRALPAGAVRDGTAGFTRDECMPNGLCQNRYRKPDSNDIERISYWIDFCTDKNVASKNCLNICRNSGNPFGNARITPCNGSPDSEEWCCGDKTDCCGTNGVVMLARVLGGELMKSTTVSSAAPSTSSAASISSTTSTPTPSPSSSIPNTTTEEQVTPNASAGLSSGAIAGIAVGVVAAIAIFAAAMFLARRRARSRRDRQMKAELPDTPVQPARYQPWVYAAEKDSYAHRVELPLTPSPVELPHTTPMELPAEVVSQGRR